MKGTKEDYVNYRRAKSLEAFQDAGILADNKRWNACIARLYYACFYMTNALLYKNDISSKTHSGTRTKFFNEFVKTGMVSKEYGKLYSDLFDWRQESDYADFIDFDEATVKPLIEQTEQFLQVVEKIIKK